MNIRGRRRRRLASATQGAPALEELERLADSTVDLAQQIKNTVAELRRQDERGDGND